MHHFTYARVADERAALDAGARGGRYIAGGTTLVDLMRETVERPAAVVDITALPYREVTVVDGRLRLGALATMTEVATTPQVREQFPMVVESLEGAASAQLRNKATIAGNVLQRPRCSYFRDVTVACNRRDPGSGCPAIEGANRMHAILGGSDGCVATHPSDLTVALVALDARVLLRSPQGDDRAVAVADFLRPPGDTPHVEHDLRPGELITAVEIPAVPAARTSTYYKVRDRESYEFAVASAAVGLDLTGGTIRSARVAAGGVGTVPWRLTQVEALLVGRPPTPEVLAAAAARAADGARPLSGNAFKVTLLPRTVERALATVAGTLPVAGGAR